MKSKIRMGMVGGGRDSFIGAVHRIAANMDGLIELCCGALSQNAEKAKASGRDLGLPENRVYTSFEEMIVAESKLPIDERMQFVSIVTPNHVHFKPAMMALEYGFNVVIDKPMTFSLEEAKLLAKKVDETGLLFCLTHTYTGYPMVKQARKMVADGMFGSIRKIYVEYLQGWLSGSAEKEGNVQAVWRTDPARSGKGGALGDVGTHAANLAEFIGGVQISKVCADLNCVVDGRVLDDDGAVLLKFSNGASGVLVSTQVAAGEENGLKIKVYGEKGGLEWRQEEPNTLLVKWNDAPTQIYRTGHAYNSDIAKQNTRVPAGHPEGYLEAFANLYKNFALALTAKLQGKPLSQVPDFPTVHDGVRGMAFIENVVASSTSDKKWIDFTI